MDLLYREEIRCPAKIFQLEPSALSWLGIFDLVLVSLDLVLNAIVNEAWQSLRGFNISALCLADLG